MNFLNLRHPIISLIGVYINDVFLFIHQIDKLAVIAEPEMSWCRFSLATDCIYLNQPFLLIIETINLYLVHTGVCRQHIFMIRSSPGACNVRPKIPFCNASHTFMEYTIHNLSYAAVPAQPQDCGLAVMVAGNKDILVPCIRRQMAASHAVDLGTVQTRKASVLENTE